MCLYPRLMDNPKYKPNKKNGGNVPPIYDNRHRTVAVGCGTCLECRKQKGRDWTARLCEDIKDHTNGKFVTLTFSTESINKIIEDDYAKRKITIDEETGEVTEGRSMKDLQGYDLDNALATRAVRLFLERWRKKYKKSLRHWLITELGHGETEHIHLHGILWTDTPEDIEKIWGYGYVWRGYNVNGIIENYVSARTVNYIVKYVSKMDEEHLNYKPVILTSAGIGAGYITKGRYRHNRWDNKQTAEFYRTSTGHKISLPIYYRNKIYTENQREQLWSWKLDKQERYVLGQKISIKTTEEIYYKALELAQERTIKLGYPTPEFIWSKKKYEDERRKRIHEKRITILKRVEELEE